MSFTYLEAMLYLIACTCSVVLSLMLNVLWLNPKRVRSKLDSQNIRGPPQSFIFGNIPEMKKIDAMVSKPPQPHSTSTLFPYFNQWTQQYGRVFVFGLGIDQFLYVQDPKLVKEINLCKSLGLGKPTYLSEERGSIFGKGLISANGTLWSHSRKTIAPQLYLDNVKNMMNMMVESTCKLMESWDNIIESEGGTADIKIDEDIRSCTCRIISKIIFGDNYEKGMELSPRLRALMKVLETPTFLSGIPFLRHFPTQQNREIRGIEKEIYSIVMEIASERSEASPKDMLQKTIENSRNGELDQSTTPDRFIVDNCKNIFIAGTEVTGISMIWGLMLLAANPEWQARARQEVLEVCQGRVPDVDMLAKMKVLKMVIQEVLRLYPAVPFLSRQALEDKKLGEICVPKGVAIWVWLQALNLDPMFWGPDAHIFNPQRFAGGVLNASKAPQVFVPFGVGMRSCPAQNYSYVEMKVMLALILSNFSFSLSQNYRHSPYMGLLIEPAQGVILQFQKI